MKIFRHLIIEEKEELLTVAFLGVISALMYLVFPIGVQTLVNSIAFTGLIQPIVILTLVVFFLLFASYSSTVFQKLAIEKVQRRLYTRSAYCVESFHDQDNNHKLARFLEVASVQKNLASLVVDGLSILLQLITGTLLLALYHSALFVFGLLLFIAVGLSVFLFLKHARKTAIAESTAKYELVDKLLVEIDPLKRPVEDKTKHYLNARASHFRILISQTIALYITAILAVTTLLALGGYLVVKGQLSIGQLVAAELVIGMISISLAKLPKHLESYYDLSASLSKLSVIYDSNVDSKTKTKSIFKEFRILPYNLWKTTQVVVVSGLLIIILILLLPWQQTSFGHGKVLAYNPSERPQTIEATVEGRIVEWKVREGDQIEKGETLVELKDLDPMAVDRLVIQRNNLHKQLQAIEIARDTAEKNLKRQEDLQKDGIVATRTLELARNEVATVTKEEASVYGKLAELDTKIARQRAQSILSPIDGFVSAVYRGGSGEIVKKGDLLATIVPRTTSRVVEIWIDGNDAPLVYPGRKVRLQFEGWPAVQFSGWPGLALGTFEGRVKIVDWADNGYGFFRVLVEEDGNTKWPDPALLRQGVRAISWIQLEQVSVGYEIWRQINGFPPLRPARLEKDASQKINQTLNGSKKEK